MQIYTNLAHGYFGLTEIVNFVYVLPNPMGVSALINLATSAQEAHNLCDRVLSNVIAKAIEVSITKTYL